MSQYGHFVFFLHFFLVSMFFYIFYFFLKIFFYSFFLFDVYFFCFCRSFYALFLLLCRFFCLDFVWLDRIFNLDNSFFFSMWNWHLCCIFCLYPTGFALSEVFCLQFFFMSLKEESCWKGNKIEKSKKIVTEYANYAG